MCTCPGNKGYLRFWLRDVIRSFMLHEYANLPQSGGNGCLIAVVSDLELRNNAHIILLFDLRQDRNKFHHLALAWCSTIRVDLQNFSVNSNEGCTRVLCATFSKVFAPNSFEAGIKEKL